MTIRADLHIHSCLSPCGDLTMSPRAIAAAAVESGLDLLALTDHNTARNVPAFAAACRDRGIAAVFGCEATSSEEVHVLALFEEERNAIEFGDEIYASLPDARHDPVRFGDQVVVDEQETIVDTLQKHLIAASAWSLTELGRLIHERGGLFIPAHIDRGSFSVWSQLGFLPSDAYDAVERVGEGRIDSGDLPVIAASDAHEPARIGCRATEFEGARPGFAALRAALKERRVRTIARSE